MEERLQRQPFGGEPVQRGQSCDGRRSDEECGPGPRHAPQQPAEPIEIERSHRPLERPRAEEEQRLEDGMVDRVQQSGSQRERRPLVTRGTLCPQQQAGSDTEQDDADVLDRVEREQLLELVPEQRVGDAAEGREQPQHEDERPDPGRRPSEPLDEHADEAVDRDLDHHAAHQRRHVRGGDRMGAWEPRMERHHARLRPETDDRGERDGGLEARPLGESRRVADRIGVDQQEQGDPDAGAAEVRDRDVHEDRVAGALVGVADEDDRRRDERHQLPEDEERERVPGAENTGEGKHERRSEEGDRAAAAAGPEVVGGEYE